MEIEGNDGSKTLLKPGSTIQFGRGQGFSSSDRTVSRRHVSFGLDNQDEPKVRFEVTGKNPIWVQSKESDKVETYRKLDKGEISDGDMFCVSAENPIWFSLKKVEIEEENENRELVDLGNDLAESSGSAHGAKGFEELDIEAVDISDIDPIKEFGLVVMGHEFDNFAKKLIRNARKWEWFIEEPVKEEDDTDDDDGDGRRKGKKRERRKKKKGDENDEEWTGESEEDKELVSKSRKVMKPAYSTRSKDRKRAKKDSKFAKPSGRKKSSPADEEEVEGEDSDEDDETLGGFIVDDVPEEEDEMDEDEEEEFTEDEYEEDLDE